MNANARSKTAVSGPGPQGAAGGLTPSAAARRVYDRVNDITNVMITVQTLAAKAVECADAGHARQAVDLWSRARAELEKLRSQRAFGQELLDLAELQILEAIDCG